MRLAREQRPGLRRECDTLLFEIHNHPFAVFLEHVRFGHCNPGPRPVPRGDHLIQLFDAGPGGRRFAEEGVRAQIKPCLSSLGEVQVAV